MFRRSKIDTQETSLNVVSVSSLLTLEKSPPKHYLISRIVYLLIMFFWHKTQRNMRFYYLKMPVNLTQYRGTVGTFNTLKSIFQRSSKTFSFLNYVNIESFQSYFLSSFILFVFLFLELKYNGHKISMKFFVWFLFLKGFSLNTSFWLQILLALLCGDVEKNTGPKRSPKASLSICHWNLNSISGHNYVKLSLLRVYLAFHKFDIVCFLKHILILIIHLVMKHWKYLDTI